MILSNRIEMVGKLAAESLPSVVMSSWFGTALVLPSSFLPVPASYCLSPASYRLSPASYHLSPASVSCVSLVAWNNVKILWYQLGEILRLQRDPWLFTKKTPCYGYRDPHYKPKTVWRPSQVYNGNPYTDKTSGVFLVNRGPGDTTPW